MRQKAEGEHLPLVMVSDDEDEKIEWMVARLRDVYTAYNNEMPSVGVSITNGMSVDGFGRSFDHPFPHTVFQQHLS